MAHQGAVQPSPLLRLRPLTSTIIVMSILQAITIALPAAIGLAGLAWAVASWRRTGSKLEAELAFGQIDYGDGLLSVEFPSGTPPLFRSTMGRVSSGATDAERNWRQR